MFCWCSVVLATALKNKVQARHVSPSVGSLTLATLLSQSLLFSPFSHYVMDLSVETRVRCDICRYKKELYDLLQALVGRSVDRDAY